MSDKSGRWWDESWGLVDGCSPVSEGCAHCWSASSAHMRKGQKNERIRQRYTGLTNDCGVFNGCIKLNEDALDKPLRRRKPTVWAVWNDLFHPGVPPQFINKVLETCRKAPRHTFVILTKRPERLVSHTILNVVLGTSVENQAAADERLPHIIQFGEAGMTTVVSVEPLLEPIVLPDEFLALGNRTGIIVGGETGRGARRMAESLVLPLRDQCDEFGVNFFFKQWGSADSIGGRTLLDQTFDALPWKVER